MAVLLRGVEVQELPIESISVLKTLSSCGWGCSGWLSSTTRHVQGRAVLPVELVVFSFDKQIDSIIGIKYQLDWAFVQSQPFWRRQVLLAVELSVILQLPESTQQLQLGRDPVLRWCTLFLLLRMLNSLSTLQSAKTTQTSHAATPLSNN